MTKSILLAVVSVFQTCRKSLFCGSVNLAVLSLNNSNRIEKNLFWVWIIEMKYPESIETLDISHVMLHKKLCIKFQNLSQSKMKLYKVIYAFCSFCSTVCHLAFSTNLKWVAWEICNHMNLGQREALSLINLCCQSAMVDLNKHRLTRMHFNQ